MTEDEAKTKWCPQGEHRDWKCIGSACMAWRWHQPTYSGRYGETPTGEAPTEGHCGLASRP
jgi:hypothetical protein